MGNSLESATDKLRRGQSLLASGSNESAIIGTALIALHGAMEDRLRELLASRLPDRREKIFDKSNFQWKEILSYAEQYLGLSKPDSDFIFQANTHRNAFAHSGNLYWNREGVKKYEELIYQLWATGARKPDPYRPGASVPASPVKRAANLPQRGFIAVTAPVYGLPSIQIVNRPWYRSLGWYWVFFLFVLPVWAILILTDKQAGRGAKSAAVMLFAVFLAFDLALLNFLRVVPVPAFTMPVLSLPVTSSGAPTPTDTTLPTTAVRLASTQPAGQPTQQPSLTSTAVKSSCWVVWEQYASGDLNNKNRSMVWSEVVNKRVSGSTMRAEEFFQQVVEYNPQLKADGYVFRGGKTYSLPKCK